MKPFKQELYSVYRWRVFNQEDEIIDLRLYLKHSHCCTMFVRLHQLLFVRSFRPILPHRWHRIKQPTEITTVKRAQRDDRYWGEEQRGKTTTNRGRWYRFIQSCSTEKIQTVPNTNQSRWCRSMFMESMPSSPMACFKATITKAFRTSFPEMICNITIPKSEPLAMYLLLKPVCFVSKFSIRCYLSQLEITIAVDSTSFATKNWDSRKQI